jgi:hypothetical protein
MSTAPSPYIRPPATVGVNGSVAQSRAGGTVSRWPVKVTNAGPGPSRALAYTFGRPGATSCTTGSAPMARSSAATNSPSACSSGRTDRMATIRASSSWRPAPVIPGARAAAAGAFPP